MQIFIGSSRESNDTKDWLAAEIQKLGHKPIPWDEPGLFRPGRDVYGQLIEISQQVDAAVFVFSNDDRVWYRGNEIGQPRDNVLIEYGLFSGALGSRRCIICTEARPKIGNDDAQPDKGTDRLPKIGTDLLGIIFVDVSENNRHRARLELGAWMKDINALPPTLEHEVTPIRLYKQADHNKFKESLSESLRTAKRIVMIGSGLAALGSPPLVQELVQRAAKLECRVEIYMAHPFSPAVETRLIEEELGAIKPPDGQSGLLGRLKMLLDAWRANGTPDTFAIRLCTHYPTFALIIVDDEYFVYPYAYALLGNFSPVIHFSRSIPGNHAAVTFLDEQYKRVQRDALDAASVLDFEKLHVGRSPNEFQSLAVYFVPDAGSPLYEFGSRVLGYDVRRGTTSDPQGPTFVGPAAQYGFHLTIGDVLYFLNEAEVHKAVKEVEFLATQFRPFQLNDLKIKNDFPGKNALSIAVTDKSRSLEALHCELVHRIYRRAVASGYTLNEAFLNRGGSPERQEVMLKRYRAPYVLAQFMPHFTLMTDVPRDQQQSVQQDLTLEFKQVPRQVQVQKIAIMSRTQQGFWRIQKEIELGNL